MDERNYSAKTRSLKLLTLCSLLFAAHNATAAYVDAAGATAVVNDATAAYYNPAALTLVQKNQVVLIGIASNVYSHFSGTATQTTGGRSETGSASTATNYYLPNAYLAIPVSKNVVLGFGSLYIFYGASEYYPNSILRYFGTTSFISVIDFIPSIGVRLSDKFSVGAGLDFDIANVTLNQMLGFVTPALADGQVINKASGSGVGGHVGILVQPKLGTTIGLAYHSFADITFTGSSNRGALTTNQFHTRIPVVPSTVFTIDQFVNPKLGFLGTVAYTQWNHIQRINLQNVATTSIVPSSVATYLLRNTWRFTLGTHYELNPKWMLTGAITYDQDPVNRFRQLAVGDYYVLGMGAGYSFTKDVKFNLNYAHTFYKGANINITSGSANIVTGTNRGHRDTLVGKLTWNL